MSFKQKTWNDRISEHPNRRTLTDVSDNTTKTVNVAREEGTISQEGDAFSAANMNDLESRIADGFSTLSQDSLKMSSSNPSSDSIKFGINASGQYGYIKQGTSEVTPFRNPTGNASPSDVLSGKTFSTASLENASGTMANQGSHQSSTGVGVDSTGPYAYFPAGYYHNGSGSPYIYMTQGQANSLARPQNGTNKKAVSVGGGSGSLYAYMPYGYYDNYNNSGNAWIDITNDQAKTLANNAGVGYNAGYSAGKAVAKTANVSVSGSINNYGDYNFTVYVNNKEACYVSGSKPSPAGSSNKISGSGSVSI